MGAIILPENFDYKKAGKDCADFKPLNDGTLTGDQKYCDLSLVCRQIGYIADWYEFIDGETRERKFDYFCTGMIADAEYKEEFKGTDEKVS